jgi:hypothetical protein
VQGLLDALEKFDGDGLLPVLLDERGQRRRAFRLRHRVHFALDAGAGVAFQ